MNLKAVSTFWDLYFTNALVSLERLPTHYRFEAFEPGRLNSPASWFNLDEAPATYELPLDCLAQYKYLEDERFKRLALRPFHLRDTLTKIGQTTYPYRDAAPLPKRAMSERLMEIFPARLLQDPGTSDAILEAIATRTIQTCLDKPDDSLSTVQSALIWVLGEHRSRASAPVLVQILMRAAWAPFRAHEPVSELQVNLALSALLKINDKSSLPQLLALFENCEVDGRRKLAPLLERQLSRESMPGILRSGERYLDPANWSAAYQAALADCQGHWPEFEAREVFWEHRFLAAWRADPSDHSVLEVLQHDEVRVVALLAQARLGAKGA